MIFKAQACGGGEPPRKAEGGGEDLGLIHNFGTHFLCTKSYGILGEKGGSSISLVHFFGVFLEGFVFPFFVFEGGEWGPGKDGLIPSCLI